MIFYFTFLYKFWFLIFDFWFFLFIFKIIISDRTSEVGLEYVKRYGSDKIRVLTLKQNQGKGGAVQQVDLKYIWNIFEIF